LCDNGPLRSDAVDLHYARLRAPKSLAVPLRRCREWTIDVSTCPCPQWTRTQVPVRNRL